MTSLEFEDITSQFYSKVRAYDFLSISDEEVDELISSWLRSTVSDPYVRRLFSSFELDMDTRSLSFEMKYSLGASADTDFVIELLSFGMVNQWLKPKVYNLATMAQRFGSKDELFYSQSQHLKEMKALQTQTYAEIRRMAADRGYLDNEYLDGDI